VKTIETHPNMFRNV